MKNRQTGLGLPAIFGLLLLLFLLSAVALSLISRHKQSVDSDQSEILSYAGQALSLSLIAKDALNGDEDALEDLERKFKRLETTTAVADVASRVDGVSEDTARRAWGQLRQGIEGIMQNKQELYAALDSSALVGQVNPDLLSQLDGINATFTNAQQDAFSQVKTSYETQLRYIDRAVKQLTGNITSRNATEEKIVESLATLDQITDGLSGTNGVPGVPVVSNVDALQALVLLKENQQQLRSYAQGAMDNGELIAAIYRSSEQVESASQAIYAAAATVRADLESQEVSWWQSWWLPLVLLAGAAVSALTYMLLSALRARKLAASIPDVATVENTDQNQEAILRLLDEMGNLADGDLTVEATVTEDITGAIADSINYAIEALRDLVSTIDGGAESVDSAAKQTQAAANHLAKSSDSQSKQVASATDSIAKMAASIEQVSSNAERSSEVARHSVEIAHKGGEAVRRTIDGMNTIRETIQDTSKRIKRLGESSQEIGNIVELINDIAEQTNILALNASIQASMAGEAGRGFGVVADEVQRLAERSTNATKQIEVLVKTIQSDTNEAVVSMERSTTDVVSGALLAENAGAALDEIEKVSNQIASLVQNISGSARQQATVASDVTRNMGVLQEISAQTAENTSATSHSISKLAEMAAQMRRSVAGFTLPQEVVHEDVEAEDEMLFRLANEENEFIDTLIVDEKVR